MCHRLLCILSLTMRSHHRKCINNRNPLYYFYSCNIYPNRRHGIRIRPLVVTKIICPSHLNIWHNLLHISRKRQTAMRMNIDRNKGIFPYFGRNVLDDCIDDYDELPMVDLGTNIPPRHLQELPCLSHLLTCLEFIIHFI